MAQQNLIMCPVMLFEHKESTAPPKEHGTCSMALVAQGGAASAPRYKLICYNDQRHTLCAATVTGSNEHSLQFQMQTGEYGNFKDDVGTMFNLMFLRSVDVDPFLAHLGTCFFGASSQPSHTTVVADFCKTETRQDAGRAKTLELGKRAKMRYVAFNCQRAVNPGDVPKLGQILETEGDVAYAFDPVQSPFAILPDGKGFESSVLGMVEDTKRVVVVPEALPRGCHNPLLNNKTLVFVLTLHRVVNDMSNGTSGAAEASGALVLTGPSGAASKSAAAGALVVPQANTPPPPAADESRGVASGGGVPAEHMLLVQKMAGQINTATSTLRDLQDRVDNFAQEWKGSINKPKPTVMTPAALENNIKNLVLEHERVKEEVLRREELIRAIDERNRELQKRVDKAAMLAQQLMDEKKVTAATRNDQRLDSDRQTMKIQEELMRARNERDDLTRHLHTVKKLLEVSDTELRDVKGRSEVLKLQIAGVTDKLDASEERMGEERSRRKAYEAKVAAIQDEIRNSQAELHLKTAQLEDLRRKADTDRIHYMQMMEDERARRGIEAAQLRSEIVDDLQQREEKFQADRARVAEDNWARGHDEGREVGRRNARADIETRLHGLQLDAQRAKTELDAYKSQVRTAQEDAMAENRRFETQVVELKRQVEDMTKKKAQVDYKTHTLQLKVRNANDSLFLGFTSVAQRMNRPAEPHNLMNLLTAMKEHRPIDMTFQDARLHQESEDAHQRRQQWISEELESLHSHELSQMFYRDFINPSTAMYDEFLKELYRLWEDRDCSTRKEIEETESLLRNSVEADEGMHFDDIVEFLNHLIGEQQEVIREESNVRLVAESDSAAWFDETFDAIAALIAEIVEQQRALISEEEEGRKVVEGAAEAWQQEAFADIIAMRKQWAEEQDALIEEETAPRVAIEEEADAWQQEAFRDIIEMRKRWAEEQDEIIRAEEAPRAAIVAEYDTWYEPFASLLEEQKGVREQVCHDEASQRDDIVLEEATDSKEMFAGIEKILFQEIIDAQTEVMEEETRTRESTVVAEERRDWELLEEASVESLEAVAEIEEARRRWEQGLTDARQQLENEGVEGSAAIGREQDAEWKDLLKTAKAEKPAPKVVKPAFDPLTGEGDPDAAPDDDASSSSSEDMRDSLGPFAPRPKNSAANSTRTSTAAAASPPRAQQQQQIFDSSDSDTGLPTVARKAPMKAAVSKTTTRSAGGNLFDTDSDDSDAPPRPVAKRTAPKPASKAAKIFDSSDDD